ncbi:MAG TPA: HAMP domain-containing sensor histidine kinase, partial [Chloroflexota bacterium]|nr:HAMP domain-containing sensor histidine kinase [Chloroflexota bacterium]
LSPAIVDESHFVNSTSRSLALAALVGGLLALLLALVLSARILRPVQALTAAAREMARGDLAQRVPVRGHDELGVLARAFNAMADSVARAERLRRTMLGDVAHDLRTPLTSIDGYLEAIEDGLVRPTPEVISGLRGDVVLLKRLVEDLQELAQAEAGQLHFDRRPLDLAAILQQAAAALLPQARAKGVHLEVDAPAALPLALADAQRVGQVVRNLLQNAVTATPSGGRVTVSAGGDPLEVRVADTGIGIPPDHLPNVFERFYRVDPARNRTTGGSGLGLAIVKQLVEQQGGRVAAESRVGQGSVFQFTLPQAPAGVAADETALLSPVHSAS